MSLFGFAKENTMESVRDILSEGEPLFLEVANGLYARNEFAGPWSHARKVAAEIRRQFKILRETIILEAVADMLVGGEEALTHYIAEAERAKDDKNDYWAEIYVECIKVFAEQARARVAKDR